MTTREYKVRLNGHRATITGRDQDTGTTYTWRAADGQSDGSTYPTFAAVEAAARQVLGQRPPAPRPAARPGPVDTVSRHMADSFGVTSSAPAEGRCHYCGQHVGRHGCEECV